MDDQPQKKSYKLVWIAGASLTVFIVVLGVTILLVAGSSDKGKNQTSSTTASTSATQTVATKADVKKSLDDVSATLKQAASDQAAAKAALGDSKNQEKVGN